MGSVKQILEKLSDPIKESGLSVGEMIYHPYKILYGDLEKLYRKDTLQRALRRSKKAGLIKKRKINDKIYIALTELGKEKLNALRDKLNINIELEEKEWDGKYRMVLFDIPEKNRPVRDLLRSKLKELGFVGWQKSVWVSKQDVTNELRRFFKEANLDDYALVIETEDLDNRKLEYLVGLK